MRSAAEGEVRERLGKFAFGAGPDVRAVAVQVGGEQVEAAAVAMWQSRGWMVVATDRGLRWSRRPRVLGRGRDERREWADLAAVRRNPASVTFVFAGEDVTIAFAGPDEQIDRILALARRHVRGDDPEDAAGLTELARRKLGRALAWTYSGPVEILLDRLEDGERVERLAVASLGFDGLLVLTDRRLLLLTVAIRARSEERWELPREEILDAVPAENGLALELADGTVLLHDVLPPERINELVAVLARREPER